MIDTITVGAFPNAAAITPDGNFLYVVNALDGTASVVDTTTNTVVDTVTVGNFPGGVGVTTDGSALM